MAAALGYRADGTAARLCFHLQEASYNTDALIGVLEQLGQFSTGQRAVLLWDGLSAHWSTRMRLGGQPARLAARGAATRRRTRAEPRSRGCGPT
jgi:hypothetical protein